MCHGIVREYCKKYDRVTIFSYPHNFPTVSFMFRDLKNLNIIKGDDAYIRKYILEQSSNTANPEYDLAKIIGFQYLNHDSGMPLEKQFYSLAGLDISKKWDSFYIERNKTKEEELFNKVAPKGDYAFVHEDLPRKYLIDRDKIGSNCQVFKPERGMAESIIDYCTIIEKAKEIHVIDSSFMFLIDCLDYTNPEQKLFVHRYSRENDAWKLPILKKNWKIITKSNAKKTFSKIPALTYYNLKNKLKQHPLFIRALRKIYRMRGKQLTWNATVELDAFIRRYSSGKTFLCVNRESFEDDKYVNIAKEVGASIIEENKNHANRAQVVFSNNKLSSHQDPLAYLRELRKLCDDTLIIITESVPEFPTYRNMAVFYPSLNESQKALWNTPLYDGRITKGRYEPPSGNLLRYWGLTPSAVESMLVSAGFEIKEKQIFDYEAAFVCGVK